MVILYLETNFVLSVATGRDPAALRLLAAEGPPVRLAIPTICFMEALSAIQGELNRWRDFQRRLKDQSNQVARDLVSPFASSLEGHLKQASIDMDGHLNEMEARFLMASTELGHRAESIDLARSTLLKGLADGFFPRDQRPDNMILWALLDHAQDHPGPTKGFLSGNTHEFQIPEVRQALGEVGVSKYFTKAQDCLDWLASLPAAGDAPPSAPTIQE